MENTNTEGLTSDLTNRIMTGTVDRRFAISDLVATDVTISDLLSDLCNMNHDWAALNEYLRKLKKLHNDRMWLTNYLEATEKEDADDAIPDAVRWDVLPEWVTCVARYTTQDDGTFCVCGWSAPPCEADPDAGRGWTPEKHVREIDISGLNIVLPGNKPWYESLVFRPNLYKTSTSSGSDKTTDSPNWLFQ